MGALFNLMLANSQIWWDVESDLSFNGGAAVAAFAAYTLDMTTYLFAVLAMLLLAVALLQGVRAAILAAAVEFAGSREGAVLAFPSL